MAADDDPLPYRFGIAAIDLRMLLKQLKPAFPKKKDVARTRLGMEVSPGRLRCLLPGAVVGTVARSDGTFRVELPFVEVEWMAKEQFRDGEVLTFAFAPGRMNYRGVGVSRPDIRVTEVAAGGEPAGSAAAGGGAAPGLGGGAGGGGRPAAAYRLHRTPTTAGGGYGSGGPPARRGGRGGGNPGKGGEAAGAARRQ